MNLYIGTLREIPDSYFNFRYFFCLYRFFFVTADINFLFFDYITFF